MSNKKIIGIAGKPGSGKTSIASWLQSTYNYYILEGSDFLREKAKEKNVELITRDDYSNLHRQLQKESGKSVMIDHLLGLAHQRVALVGLRSKYNAEKIQSQGGVVIYLDAPVELRYERKKANNLFDFTRLTDFITQEENQMKSIDGLGADLESVQNIAEYTIDTSSSLENSQQKLTEILLSHDL